MTTIKYLALPTIFFAFLVNTQVSAAYLYTFRANPDYETEFDARFASAFCSDHKFSLAANDSKILSKGVCGINAIYAIVFDPACYKNQTVLTGQARIDAIAKYEEEMKAYRAAIGQQGSGATPAPVSQPGGPTVPVAPSLNDAPAMGYPAGMPSGQTTTPVYPRPIATGGGGMPGYQPAGGMPGYQPGYQPTYPPYQPVYTPPVMPVLKLNRNFCIAKKYNNPRAGTSMFSVVKTKDLSASGTDEPEYEVVIKY